MITCSSGLPAAHRIRCGVALLMLIAPCSVGAQGLRGVVTDTLGRPVVEAEVILDDGRIRARTDSLGRYRLRLPRPTTVGLRVRRIGFREYAQSVRVAGYAEVVVAIRLVPVPPRLTTVVITEARRCDSQSLMGFECRRDAGVGAFRDAGELRSLRPRYWADMLDGMPGLRREAVMGPFGLDWRPVAPPGRCLRELWNGRPSAGDPSADHVWQPLDVVAIEYYDTPADIPATYQRFAWSDDAGTGRCAVLVYWLRGAARLPAP